MNGIIIKSTGSWYGVRGEDDRVYQGRLPGKFKLNDNKITNPLAVGDLVIYEKDTHSENQVLITKILPRNNYIVRKSVHKTAHAHLLAANLDQAMLIVTLAHPRTSTGFIDRFLVSSEAYEIPSILVFNKIDIYEKEDHEQLDLLKETYTEAGYECLAISVENKNGIDAVRASLENKKTLIAGHSGVGKSSLINLLIPSLALKTSEVSSFADKGTHTTTFAEMHTLNINSFIIDTPGIKELGLFDIDANELAHYFPEMVALLGTCKFHNCLHVNEPGCMIIKKVKEGMISISRYQGYLSMLENEEGHR